MDLCFKVYSGILYFDKQVKLIAFCLKPVWYLDEQSNYKLACMKLFVNSP